MEKNVQLYLHEIKGFKKKLYILQKIKVQITHLKNYLNFVIILLQLENCFIVQIVHKIRKIKTKDAFINPIFKFAFVSRFGRHIEKCHRHMRVT